MMQPNENEIDIPIYLITGFLEGGKTSFINFTVQQEYFQIEEPTLLIACEEGEEEYDTSLLKKHHTILEVVENPEDFTPDLLKTFEMKYKPDRIILEYNPLWSVKRLEEMEMPKGWGIVQHIVTVDGSSFQLYMNNMKSIFMEMVKNADMVMFNRCTADLPLANFRRSIKVVNPGAEILFEDQSGELTDIFEDSLPYDLEDNPVLIDDVDYGIFYVDAGDHPERYEGKTVKFKGMVLKSRDVAAGFFVPGRMAMTCCADDTTFIGYICKSPDAKKLVMGQWVMVTAEVGWEYVDTYREEGPVLYASEIKPCDPPKSEMVYFN
ncbi:TIGR03943 family putative permease subunit [Novisyntrophococcus fermenticellae]|uniref:TIGR03943 family putative permease subunit n=1 Tax=Novisyntrophococcus fermenticellae TaxID=2068655 RepID=UPI001E32ADCC|nr:GTP-binding protein [Novisyntrophococcus fermenticellae]